MPRRFAWLVLVLATIAQVWTFFSLVGAWGFWRTALFFFVLGVISARASRMPFVRALLFPHRLARWEERRHWFQAILFIAAAVTAYLPQMDLSILDDRLADVVRGWPQPWLPLAIALALIKSGAR